MDLMQPSWFLDSQRWALEKRLRGKIQTSSKYATCSKARGKRHLYATCSTGRCIFKACPKIPPKKTDLHPRPRSQPQKCPPILSQKQSQELLGCFYETVSVHLYQGVNPNKANNLCFRVFIWRPLWLNKTARTSTGGVGRHGTQSPWVKRPAWLKGGISMARDPANVCGAPGDENHRWDGGKQPRKSMQTKTGAPYANTFLHDGAPTMSVQPIPPSLPPEQNHFSNVFAPFPGKGDTPDSFTLFLFAHCFPVCFHWGKMPKLKIQT